jgi:hypothetical protein
MTTQDGYMLGHSPPYPANRARGISNERKWQALCDEKPSHRLFRLVSDRELTDAQKWEDLLVELGYPKAEAAFRNVGDILYSFTTGWSPNTAHVP